MKKSKPYVDNTKYESYSIQDDSPYNHINRFVKNHPEIMKTPLQSFSLALIMTIKSIVKWK